jgi:F-type H+-transporting ATPase subunit c
MKKYTPALAAVALLLVSNAALAQDAKTSALAGNYGVGVGLALGLAAMGGAIGQGNTVRGFFEGVSRNPQAAGQMNTQFYVGLALIESLVLVAFGGLYLMLSKF